MINVGDSVVFTGHGYRRAIAYDYAALFGDDVHQVVGVRESCCNRFLILKGIDGMYSDVFFRLVDNNRDYQKTTPGTPIPDFGREAKQRGGYKT